MLKYNDRPSKYRMLTDRELGNFRNLLRHCKGVPLRDLGPAGAFDAAIEEEASSPAPARARGDVLRLLKTLARMSPEDWASFQRELLDDGEGAEDDLPKNGIKPGIPGAMDARRLGFDQRFPEAARVEPASSYGSRRPVHAPKGSAADFAERFPDAAKVGRA